MKQSFRNKKRKGSRLWKSHGVDADGNVEEQEDEEDADSEDREFGLILEALGFGSFADDERTGPRQRCALELITA